MTWHTFFAAFSNSYLWYLPTAYFLVWALQGGYLLWMAIQWSRSGKAGIRK